MPNGDVYLVGSVPLPSAADVFEQAAASLGDRIGRIPDGETGPRLMWILALEPVFANHPAFERTEERYVRATAAFKDRYRYQLKEGVDPATLTFGELPDVAAALASYQSF